MYFWKDKKLAQKLKEDKLSEKDKLKYLLAHIILFSSLYFLPMPGSQISLFIVQGVFLAVISIVGIIWCFKENKKGDNKSFIERFVVLSLPLSIKYLVVTIFLGILSAVVLGIISGLLGTDLLSSFDSYEQFSYGFNAILGIVVYIFFYKILKDRIGEVAGK